jgi:hypothetical protein
VHAIDVRNVQALDGVKCFDDNYLLEEEVDFICGMYYVYTSKFPIFTLTYCLLISKLSDNGCIGKLSWWPRPHAWAGSGLDVGFWSERYESWFQTRLENIQQGVSHRRNSSNNNGPVNNTHWKHGLKFNGATKKFKKNLDAACSDCLATKATGKLFLYSLMCTSNVLSALINN